MDTPLVDGSINILAGTQPPYRVLPGTVREVPMTPVPAGPIKGWRNGTLPNGLVGGYAERGDYAGRTLDNGYSPHNRAGFLGQGTTSVLPQPVPAYGPGTPSTRAASLLAGFAAQQTVLQPVTGLAGSAAYVAALSPVVEE